MMLVLWEGPGALEWEAMVASMEALVTASRSGPRPQISKRQGQGVDPHHHAVPPGHSHEDQVPGRDLSLLPAYQGI